jgi:predicted GIY-YIG superfamily endonuclease
VTKEILPGRDMKIWIVYILERDGRLYTGMTSDLQSRLCQHGWPRPLYTEMFETQFLAAKREKQIKGWKEAKKRDLIMKSSQ